MKKLMLLHQLTPGQERDALITVTGTQLCARVGELKRLKICYLLVNHDVAYSRRFCGSARQQSESGRGSRISCVGDSTPDWRRARQRVCEL